MKMVNFKKIDLEVNGGVEQYSVKRLKINQLQETMKILGDIVGSLQADESIRALIEETFSAAPEFDEEAVKNFTEEEIEKLKAENKQASDDRFKEGLFGSFHILLIQLPEQAIKLLSVASGIEEDVLGEQELEVGLDVFDALIEVNDVIALKDRLKKSFDSAQSNLKFLTKRRKATKPAKTALR